MSVLVYSVFTQVCVAWVALQLYLPLWKSGDCTKGCFFGWDLDLFFGFSINSLSTSGKNCSASVELNSIQWFDRLFSLKCCQYTERVAAEHCRCLYLTFMWFTLICHYFCEAPCEAPAYKQQHRLKFTTDPRFYSQLSCLYPGIRRGYLKGSVCVQRVCVQPPEWTHGFFTLIV